MKAWVARTGLPDAVKAVSHSTTSVLNRSADGIKRTGQVVTFPVKLVAETTILGSVLKRDPVEDASRVRDNSVSRAADVLAERNLSIPTLR